MKTHRTALIGVGATGSVLAAALLTRYSDTIIVGRKPGWIADLGQKGLNISGAINFSVPVKNYAARIEELRDARPDLIFLSTKTFHLADVLYELEQIYILAHS